MEALEFLKAYDELCGTYEDCRDGCPLHGTEFCSRAFGNISEEGFEEAVRIIKTWLEEKESPFEIKCRKCGSEMVLVNAFGGTCGVEMTCLNCGAHWNNG